MSKDTLPSKITEMERSILDEKKAHKEALITVGAYHLKDEDRTFYYSVLAKAAECQQMIDYINYKYEN